MWLKTSEERSNPLEDPKNSIAQALMMMGGARTITGRPMNDGAALSLSAVFNAVTVIAGDIATIPLKVYRRLDGGGRAEENGHPLWDILGLEPYPMVTSAAWREASQGHRLLRGNSYSEIISNRRGVVTGLMPVSPNKVTRKGAIYEIDGAAGRRVNASNMLHTAGPGGNGIDGWSVITLARENWSLAQALEESNIRFIANAAQPSGFLSNPNPLTPEAAKRARQMFDRASGGVEKRGGTPVLDGEWSWTQTSLTAEDAQYITSRQFAVTDIARWFNIPPHKIADLERATFSNIAEQSTDYVEGTLRPWVVRDEMEMNTKLLTEAERKAGLFIAYNIDGLQRGDIKTRMESARTEFEIGGLTPNEHRARENRNPVEGGDRSFIRLDMAPLDRIDQIQSVTTDEEGRTEVKFFPPEARAREYRSPDTRIALRSAFASLLLDAAGRMVRGELRNVRRILSRTISDELRRAIEAYYMDEHPDFATDVMGPVFRSYAESVSSAAAAEIDSEVRIDTVTVAETYTETFATRYSASSRRALVDMDAEEIESRLIVWSDGNAGTNPRHEQVAQREVVRLAESVARATFVAGGVATLVWRTLGDSCPFCTKLNGRVVSRSTPFMFKGDSLEGNEGDSPLVVKSHINHAPAHRGCDCTIVPGGSPGGRSVVAVGSEHLVLPTPEVRTPVTVNVTVPDPPKKSGSKRVTFHRDATGAVEWADLDD